MSIRKSSKSQKSNANLIPIYMYVALFVLTERNGKPEWKRHQYTVSDRKAIRNAYLPVEKLDTSEVRRLLADSHDGTVKLPLTYVGATQVIEKLDAVPVSSLDEAAKLLKAKARIQRMIAYKSAVPDVSKVVICAGYDTK